MNDDLEKIRVMLLRGIRNNPDMPYQVIEHLLAKVGSIKSLNSIDESLLLGIFDFVSFRESKNLVLKLLDHGLSLQREEQLEPVFGSFTVPIPQYLAARVSYFPGAMVWIYWLVENGYFDINTTDKYGATVLHWVASSVNGPHKIDDHFRKLINLGADLDLKAEMSQLNLVRSAMLKEKRPVWLGQSARRIALERGLTP